MSGHGVLSGVRMWFWSHSPLTPSQPAVVHALPSVSVHGVLACLSVQPSSQQESAVPFAAPSSQSSPGSTLLSPQTAGQNPGAGASLSLMSLFAASTRFPPDRGGAIRHFVKAG